MGRSFWIFGSKLYVFMSQCLAVREVYTRTVECTGGTFQHYLPVKNISHTCVLDILSWECCTVIEYIKIYATILHSISKQIV